MRYAVSAYGIRENQRGNSIRRFAGGIRAEDICPDSVAGRREDVMPNPYLPQWEYIPDGEPRVFGNRVYVYGSHDRAGSDRFCDYVLKCWSAPLNNPGNWVCHGDIFHTRADRDHAADTLWTGENNELYAPDVVEKDGKYYLYAYIINSVGCVAVSDRPEGPFRLLSQYLYTVPDSVCCSGWFIDPGVLVDDDGRVYIYCGYERSFMAEVNAENMYEILDGSCIEHIIPREFPAPKEGEKPGEAGELRSAKQANPPTAEGIEVADSYGFEENDSLFFEACSPRKIGNLYYLIYSPRRGSRLAYATAQRPTGPFTYRGYIVDNGVDYPGGNNHGSVACINGQWYVFYHRMTNGTIMSRRGCAERITILPDGTIPPVEMTSLGFEESLSPYRITPAELACVLKGGAMVTEKNEFERVIAGIMDGCEIGYKYFDFGEDRSGGSMEFSARIGGTGCRCRLHILTDDGEGDTLREIGACEIGPDDGIVRAAVEKVNGRHALYFRVTTDYGGWTGEFFRGRCLFELKEFVFMK